MGRQSVRPLARTRIRTHHGFIPAVVESGDRVVAHAEGLGRIVLEREHDVLAEHAGALTGVYGPTELDALRGQWD